MVPWSAFLKISGSIVRADTREGCHPESLYYYDKVVVVMTGPCKECRTQHRDVFERMP
ncbi:hypothetical protein [Paludibacterium purpuratum]|uniref:hypothetical protein n=1 Tax=Paludibacterium purpuratum TaxID=1144873 RepID=UPI001414CC79|nr:hypothetical protein [Paludibacterium purpuratum]